MLTLVELLAPLTSVSQLPTHPTMSRPYTSPVLTELVEETSAIMRKENQTLWKMKGLYTQLCGDYDWAPCGMMVPPPKRESQQPLSERTSRRSQRPSRTGTNGHASNGRADSTSTDVAENDDVTMADIDTETTKAVDGDQTDAFPTTNGVGSTLHNPSSSELSPTQPSLPNIDKHATHPLFEPPLHRPDRNIGLPTEEADMLRKLMTLMVQKQEEVCRGMTKLNENLLRADRLRKEVLQWAKAEPHCGPDGDGVEGEDWYDKERWGLTDDLKKGENEVEEEEVGAAAKKTRARR